MNHKNWNDRADKDLFFTILSVKNIGVISGGEWTTIGNHMRSMGYGFTNEGCRYVASSRLMPVLCYVQVILNALHVNGLILSGLNSLSRHATAIAIQGQPFVPLPWPVVNTTTTSSEVTPTTLFSSIHHYV